MGRLCPCPFFFGEDNMKNKTMYFIIAVCLMFLIISGCSNTENDNSVIIKVNGDDILLTDIDLARRQYSGRDVSDADLLGGLIKEKIVLQYFEKTGEQISDEEVESQYELLKTVENGNIFYEKALAEYGTDEKVKEAIKYRLMYNIAKESIKSEFLQVFSIDKRKINLRTEDFIAQFDLKDLSDEEREEYRQAVVKQYNDALIDEAFDLYFQVWLNKQVENSDIEYLNNTENPFVKKDIRLEDEKVYINQDEISLNEVTFTEAQEVYGNFLYLPNDMENNDGLTILGYHDPKEQIKVLAVKYVDESVPVNIFLGVSPDLYDLENGIKFSEKDGVNTVEISIADIGVKYIISSSIDKKLLEESLQEMIPYVLNS